VALIFKRFASWFLALARRLGFARPAPVAALRRIGDRVGPLRANCRANDRVKP